MGHDINRDFTRNEINIGLSSSESPANLCCTNIGDGRFRAARYTNDRDERLDLAKVNPLGGLRFYITTCNK